MALFGFGGRRPPVDTSARDAVAAWVRRIGRLEADVLVKVSEIVCADPACPGMETVILVMRPGHPTRAVKVARALPEVTEDDVAAALHPAA